MCRHSARHALALLLLGLLSIAFPMSARADELTLNAEFSFSDSQVVITGFLSSGGEAVAEESLLVLLDGVAVQTVRTQRGGTFQASVPLTSELAPGEHSIEVRPENALGSTSARQSFLVAEASNPAAQPELSASAPSQAVNGEIITVSGTLKTSAGAGISGVGIVVSDPTGEVADSYTITNDSGDFETLYAVAEDQGDGDLSLTLSVHGGGSLLAISTSVTVAITHLDVASPSPSGDSAQAAAVPSSPSPSPVEANSPTEAPPSTMPTAAAAHGGFGGPLSWLLTSVIGVGVLVLIAGLGLAIRTRRAARPGPEESTTLDFLDGDAEPHQAPGGPRRAAGP